MSSAVDVRDRVWPPTDLAAHESAIEFLRFLRITAVNKIAGLTDEQACRTPLATSPVMSPLGVLKHLTAVERWWVRIVLAGQDVPSLWDDDPESDWRLGSDDSVDSVVAAYEAEALLTDELLRRLPPTQTGTFEGDHRPVRSAGWVVTHLVQETARHVGHLDILRELIDGSRGE